MNTGPARRIPVPDSGDVNEIFGTLEPGDYCGPFRGYTADALAVFFILPNGAPVIDLDPGLRSVHHVASPPHMFRECDDGSLEIRESILAYGFTGSGYTWHGYLNEGNVWVWD